LNQTAVVTGGLALVAQSSHTGGHKFASNVVTYPAGHWWGYVKPEDINRIESFLALTDAERASSAGVPSDLHDLWRGRIGMTREEMSELTKKVDSKKMKKKKRGKEDGDALGTDSGCKAQ